MEEKKYEVLDNNLHQLARGMTLEMALLFMKAYTETYYNETIKLTLVEDGWKETRIDPNI